MKESKKTSLSDIPFKEEKNDFGTERYINGLIRFIEHSDAPITIALQGEWGSGKTSLMSRLERSLCRREGAPFIGVEINTWEYSMMSSPEMTVYMILARLVQELTKDDAKVKKKFNGLSRRMLGALYRMGYEGVKSLPVVGTAIGMGMAAAKVPNDLPQEKPQEKEEETVSLAELRAALKEAIARRVEDEKKEGVIVFVDDLDRLNPPVAVEILELLKNVFTIEKCIFVLAIDYDVVVKGLEPKFGKLTDKNEREFRSFFDKIIQVPFSLPVSSYEPMDFVLEALARIGYIKEIDTSNPKIKEDFKAIVNASVGKNPRSIKRLINTLSLLDCISDCDYSSEGRKPQTIDEKLLNFIVVAIQVSYPRIYRLLAHKPSFISWDRLFARIEGLDLSEYTEDEKLDWREVLEAACASDKYLTQHYPNIEGLFSMMLNIIRKSLGQDEELNADIVDDRLRKILNKSSVTGLNVGVNADELDRKALIGKLHKNVEKKLHELRPDISIKRWKNNTGNGGVCLSLDKKRQLDIVFSPGISSKSKKIALRIKLDLGVKRPEGMRGMGLDEMMEDENLREALLSLNTAITPMLESIHYLNGETFGDKKFNSFIDELRFLHNEGYLSEDITNSDTKYWIDLNKPSHFEDPEVVDTIARLLIANYDFRKAIKEMDLK